MLASHDIYPSLPAIEEAAPVDLSAGLSLRERRDISVNTFRERALQAVYQIAFRIIPPFEVVQAEEDTPRIDLSDGLSLRQRWDISGETFPARAVNSVCRLAHRRTRLDRHALPFKQYSAERPRTVTERLERIRAALNPTLLWLQAGHLTSDFEAGLIESFDELRGKPSSPEEE